MTNFRWLLWKDYRQSRLVVFAGLVLLFGPYVVGLCCLAGFRWIPAWIYGSGAVDATRYAEFFAMLTGWSLMLSQGTLALLGGDAIAGERVDRSSEFLLSLPVPRKRIVASKLCLALAMTALIWLVNVAVFLCTILGETRLWDINCERILGSAALIAVTGLTFFCVAWFLSSLTSSSTIAVCGGLMAPILVAGCLVLLDCLLFVWKVFSYRVFYVRNNGFYVYGVACLMIALIGFGIGTWRYLRRVEP